jgi:gamma-glutamyltranspeptidase/glutathione hydrolase
MRFNVLNLRRNRTLTGVYRHGNQGIALALAAMLLVACSDDKGSAGKSGFFSSIIPGSSKSKEAQSLLLESGLIFFGVAAGDEPNAVKAAEEVLKFGGTAVDAAVALTLTMTVTMPSAVSLGGGGVCIVHDPNRKKTEIIDFIAPAGAENSRADRPSAVPTLLRGLSAMHVRYGDSDLRGLLAATEKKARFGHIVSRAAARQMALAAQPLFQDPAARRIFARPDGKPYAEGDRLIQLDLADTFAEIRTGGVAGFYKGQLAKRIVKAAQDAGGTLSLDDLRNYVPKWRKPVAIAHRDQTVIFAPAPAGAGVGGGLMWNMLTDSDRYQRASGEARAHLLLETAKRAFAARGKWLKSTGSDKANRSFADPKNASQLMANFNSERATTASELNPALTKGGENPAGTGFVIVDLVGLAVSCTLTNYNLFGSGRVAPGTGVVLAAAPGHGDRNALSLGPTLSFDSELGSFRFAAAGSGGAAALSATMAVAADTMLQDRTLEQAITVPRVHHGGAPDVAVLEPTVPESIKKGLQRRGHKTIVAPSLGRVNAAECPLGLDAVSETVACFVYADPRGAGVAAEAER